MNIRIAETTGVLVGCTAAPSRPQNRAEAHDRHTVAADLFVIEFGGRLEVVDR